MQCHSHYSLLGGASAPGVLVAQAAAMGLAGLALTDHHGLYGPVRFDAACRKTDARAIIGAELTLEDGAHLVLLARTQGGYHTLCRLISSANLAGSKARPPLPFSLLPHPTAGLIALSA